MIIEVKANMKLNGGSLMRKGRYNDEVTPFPQEIYDEIKLDKKRGITHKRNMVEVLSDAPRPKQVATTLLDPDTGTNTAEPDSVEDECEDEAELEEDEKEVVPKAPAKKASTKKASGKKSARKRAARK